MTPLDFAMNIVQAWGDERASDLAARNSPLLQDQIGDGTLLLWNDQPTLLPGNYVGCAPGPGVPLVVLVARDGAGCASWLPPFVKTDPAGKSLPGVDFDVCWTIATPLGLLRWRQQVRDGLELPRAQPSSRTEIDLHATYSAMLSVLYHGDPLSDVDQSDIRFAGPLGALSSFVALMHGEEALRLFSLSEPFLAELRRWSAGVVLPR